MWTIEAPASRARRTSSAYSSGVYGMPGHCCLLATAPESAHVMMALSPTPITDSQSGEEPDPVVDLGEGLRRDGLGLLGADLELAGELGRVGRQLPVAFLQRAEVSDQDLGQVRLEVGVPRAGVRVLQLADGPAGDHGERGQQTGAGRL